MKKFITLLTALVLTALAVPLGAHSADPVPADNVKAYVLMEASTGTVLAAENANIQLECGYLSKLMALLLIAEDIETGKYRLSDKLTASQSVTGTKGSVIWLEAGNELSVEELVNAVIIGNANDALTVLAEASERSVEEFVVRMNTEAFDLGLRGSEFYSPYGYSADGNKSTAHDIGVICCKLSKFRTLRPYFKTWRDFVKSGQTELVSENTLSRTYEPHIGFKACHSDETGYCAAEGGVNNDGDRYVSVVLGAGDEDTSLGLAKKLIKKGFNEYKVTAVMFPDEMMRPLTVRGGEDTAAALCLREQNSIVIPKSVKELSTVTVLPEYIDAPVRKGQKIGTAGFYSGKELVCESDIIAAESIDKLRFGFVMREMLSKMLK